MAEKSLLVLAASRYQLEAIRKAQELGIRVITTDNTPSNPGHRLADRSYTVDTTDRERVLDLARQERIDGIIAPATDVALPTAAYVAGALGLPGPSVEAARILTGKWQFRQFLQHKGLPCPRFSSATSTGEIQRQCGAGTAPWIVKPNRASGSRGIVVVDNLSAIDRPLDEAIRLSIDSQVIIEEWLDGTQHSCEGFLSDGSLAFVLMTDRRTAPRPYTATAGHVVPSRLDGSAGRDLLDQLETVFSALGLRDGPFDCDFVSTPSGVYLLEVTPRLGGNSLSALVEAACGFDIVKAAVRYACGEEVLVADGLSPRPSAILILGVNDEGCLWFNADEVAALKREPWVRHLAMDYPVGTTVRPFVDGRERIGEALLTGHDRDDLDRHVCELETRLGLTVKTETVCA
jgi:biotin carboxylase